MGLSFSQPSLLLFSPPALGVYRQFPRSSFELRPLNAFIRDRRKVKGVLKGRPKKKKRRSVELKCLDDALFFRVDWKFFVRLAGTIWQSVSCYFNWQNENIVLLIVRAPFKNKLRTIGSASILSQPRTFNGSSLTHLIWLKEIATSCIMSEISNRYRRYQRWQPLCSRCSQMLRASKNISLHPENKFAISRKSPLGIHVKKSKNIS